MALGNKQDYLTPQNVSIESGTITHLALGEQHFGVVINNSILYTWGRAKFGQFGHNNNYQVLSPKHVSSLSGNITHLLFGQSHSGAVIDNKLYMWGLNRNYQLGFTNPSDVKSPKHVSSLSSNITHLALGG